MDEVQNYLRDPIKTEIHKSTYVIPISCLELFIQHVKSNFHSEDEGFLNSMMYTWINTSEKLIKKYEHPRSKFALFEFVLGLWSKTEKCPENILKYTSLFTEVPEITNLENTPIQSFLWMWLSENSLPTRIKDYQKKIDSEELSHWDDNNVGGIFQSRKLSKYGDVNIILVSMDKEKVIIESSTIKNEVKDIFMNMLLELPHIRDNIEIITEKQSMLVNYPFILDEWLRIIEGQIKNDVILLIKDSLRYYYDKEWRISIILSAISMEMILAGIYEKFYDRQVPERRTLGWILTKVKERNIIQDEIIEYIKITNNIRIKSVHRTSHILNEEDAITSFCGIGSLLTYIIDEYNTYN